jgi:arylsulfatase A-like enzyme
VVKTIFEAIETRVQHANTLLVLIGDHGESRMERSRRMPIYMASQADKVKA